MLFTKLRHGSISEAADMSDLFSINSLPGCADYSVEEEIGHGTYSGELLSYFGPLDEQRGA